MSFIQPSQIQTALKDYTEFGEVQGFDASIVADARNQRICLSPLS